MKRRVIQFGESTHVITLPCKWLKKNNIKKGDELNIEEEDCELRVSFDNAKKKVAKARINLNDVDKEITEPILNFIHKKGYGEINIVSNSQDVFDIIENKIPSLIGFEIIEQKSNSCTIRNITEGFESELDSIIKRIFEVTLSLAQNSLKYIKFNEYGSMEGLAPLRENTNKLTNLCQRVLNMHRLDMTNRYIYHITWLLENLAEDYHEICIITSDSPNQKLGDNTIELYTKVNKLVEEYYDIFNNFSIHGMTAFLKRQKALEQEILNSLEGNPSERKIIAILLNIAKTMKDFTDSTLALRTAFDYE